MRGNYFIPKRTFFKLQVKNNLTGNQTKSQQNFGELSVSLLEFPPARIRRIGFYPGRLQPRALCKTASALSRSTARASAGSRMTG